MTDKEKLSQSLAALRKEISQLDSSDTQQTLEGLANQIEEHLQGEQETEKNSGLLESMEQSIDEFEVEHPDLTSIINRIMVTLSNMGI